MTKKKKKVIKWIIVVLILVILSTALFFFFRKKPGTEYTTAPVERGDVVQTVSATGEIADNNELILNFEVGGRIDKIFVEEGEMVAEGEIIATLDDADLSYQTEQAKAAWDKAAAEAASNDDVIKQAKVEVENAQGYLEDTKDLNKQNIEAADQDIENAKDYYEDALDYYNEEKTATRKLTLTAAENSLKDVRENKETVEEQTDLSETSAENTLASAEAKLKTLESEHAKDSLDASVAGARANYDLALNNLSRATLKSPINGEIVEVNNKIGEVLGTGVIKESFARIISKDLLIETRIPEADVLKIKEGSRAEFTLDALADSEKFGAEAVVISPGATVIQDVVYYEAKFKIDKVDSRFKSGMTVNLDIDAAKKDGVLRIPLRAIKTEGDHKYVEILKENNQTEKVEITTGLEGDEGMAEVKSGLKEGDKVVTLAKEKK